MKRIALSVACVLALVIAGIVYANAGQTVGNNADCYGTNRTCGNGGGSVIVGNGSYTCVQGNGHNGENVSAGCVTMPKQRDSVAWFQQPSVDSYDNVPSSVVSQYADWCIGAAENTYSTPVAITSCAKSFMYGSIDMGEPNTSGHDVDWPWGGAYTADPGKSVGTTTSTCPSTSPNFWADQDTFNGGTVPEYTTTATTTNWTNTVPSGTTGQAGSIGMGWNGSTYLIYTNTSSSTLKSFVQATISNCMWGGSSGVTADSMTGTFEDNTFPGLQSERGSIWQDYPQGKNWGTNSSSPYADPTYGESGTTFIPGSFFNGVSHTTTSLITSTDTPTVTFSSNTAWENSQATLMQEFFHADGTTPWYFIANGGNNNLPKYITQTHVLGETMEEYDIGCFGTCPTNSATIGPIAPQTKTALGYPYSGRQIIDNLAMVYNDALTGNVNPNAHTITLMDMSDSGEWAEGTANDQQALRWHYFLPMIMQNDSYPQMWVSWVNGCADTACTDTWEWDFAQPAGRYQAMPPDAYATTVGTKCGEYGTSSYNFTGQTCNAGGAWDSSIQCPSTSTGMWCVEFKHLYVEQITGTAPCTQFSRANWSSCTHDIGPALVVVNDSTSNYVVSTANLQAWAPHIYSSISSGHLISLCNPASGYFNWTSGGTTYVYQYDSGNTGVSVCQGTSGEDFTTGGAPVSGDAAYHSEALSSILNDTLTTGQALVIVP